MVLYISIRILIDYSVSKQWRPRSDAASCGVYLVLHCFLMSHKMDAGLGLNGLTLLSQKTILAKIINVSLEFQQQKHDKL